MKWNLGPAAALTLTVASALSAQGWDPIKQATGWAKVDKDGSIAFYDPASRKIYSWMKDGGIIGELDVSKLQRPPEKWVVDFSSNAWVVSGRTLSYVKKDGEVYTIPLPCEVADLAWDAQGFYLSYRTPEPFIEMRQWNGESLVWYIRNRAMKIEPAPTAQHRIAVSEDKTLFIASGGSLQMQAVDCANGRIKGSTSFSVHGGLAPSLNLGTQDRGSVTWWLSKNTSISAVPASQLSSLDPGSLYLAVEDLNTSTIDFVPTGLSEKHAFIGMLDSEAVFIAPGGGLAFVPVKAGE